jgi:hypothetical protein
MSYPIEREDGDVNASPSPTPGNDSGADSGYSPPYQSPEPMSVPRRRGIWAWLVPSIAAFVIVAVGAVLAVVYVSTPRNESLARNTCLAGTADQMKNPASTKFSKVLVAKGTDKKAATPVIRQWGAHATVDDIAGVGDTALGFVNGDGSGLAKNVYVVSAAVDGTNSYGAVVRQYVLCYVGVDDSKVTKQPAELFTSSN